MINGFKLHGMAVSPLLFTAIAAAQSWAAMLYVPAAVAVHAGNCRAGCSVQITDQAPEFSDAVWSTHSARCHLEVLKTLRPALRPEYCALTD